MSPVNDEDYGNFLDYRRQLDSVKSEQIRSFDKHILAVDVITDGKGERISVCADCYAERTGG